MARNQRTTTKALADSGDQLKTQKVAKNTRTQAESAQPAQTTKAQKGGSVTKRQRDNDILVDVIGMDDSVVPNAKKARKSAIEKTPVTEQLQSPARCSGRKQTKDPVTTQTRRRRRTKAEMAADKERAESEKRQLEQLAETKKRAMMRMDIDDDNRRVEEAARAIRTFADLERSTESEGEEFDGYDEVLDSSDESEAGNNEVQIFEKPKRGLQKHSNASKVKVGGGKENRAGGKKLGKKVTFASGLVPDWNANGNATKGRPKKVVPSAHVQISAGGLDDSDAESINPFSNATEHLKTSGLAKRSLSRRNELIAIQSSDDEAEYVPHPAAKRITQKARQSVQVKSEKSEKKLPPTKVSRTAAPSIKRFSGNNVRMSDLPDFARNNWRNTFLPTLYDKFFASIQPFDGFQRGSDQFIALLQNIIEEVFPEIDFEVTESSSIHYLAYNRINEKRSTIGSNAIKVVNTHIDTLGGEKEAKKWLRWALCKDGSLFFKVPSRVNSLDENSSNQIQLPEGRLLSTFIIDLAKPLNRLRSGSASDNGYPKGLIALIMAALEHAVRYLLKPRVKVKEFSKEFWGGKVDIYYSVLEGVPDSR